MEKKQKSIDDLVDQMITEGLSVAKFHDAVTECVKERMCDGYCKYPEEYKVMEHDGNYETMIDDVCTSCPMNIL